MEMTFKVSDREIRELIADYTTKLLNSTITISPDQIDFDLDENIGGYDIAATVTLDVPDTVTLDFSKDKISATKKGES